MLAFFIDNQDDSPARKWIKLCPKLPLKSELSKLLRGAMESFVKLMVLGWAVGFLVNFIGLYSINSRG